MAVKGELYWTVLSSLGLHLSTMENTTGLLISADLAWLFRMTSTETGVRTRFRQFGDNFNIRGVQLSRNSFEGTVNLSKGFDGFDVFVEFSGRFWEKAQSYSGVAGVTASW